MSASCPVQLLLDPHNEERGSERTPGSLIFLYKLAENENEQPGETYRGGARPGERTHSVQPHTLDQNPNCAVHYSPPLAASLSDLGFIDKLTPPHGRRDFSNRKEQSPRTQGQYLQEENQMGECQSQERIRKTIYHTGSTEPQKLSSTLTGRSRREEKYCKVFQKLKCSGTQCALCSK